MTDEKEIIEILENLAVDKYIDERKLEEKDIEAIINIIVLYRQEKEKNKELSDKLTEKICKGVEEEILEEYRQTIISKDKEIEELKEDKYGLEEEVQIQAKNLMLYENALSEIQDKIKAKIEYYEKIDNPVGKRVLESLLEKE